MGLYTIRFHLNWKNPMHCHDRCPTCQKNEWRPLKMSWFLAIDLYTATTVLLNIAYKLYWNTSYGFAWFQIESWLRTHAAVRLQSLSLSPSRLCISHITDATTIMWSVGCSLFLHLSIFFPRSSLSPSLSLTVCQDTGSCGQRELWEEEAEK